MQGAGSRVQVQVQVQVHGWVVGCSGGWGLHVPGGSYFDPDVELVILLLGPVARPPAHSVVIPPGTHHCKARITEESSDNGGKARITVARMQSLKN